MIVSWCGCFHLTNVEQLPKSSSSALHPLPLCVSLPSFFFEISGVFSRRSRQTLNPLHLFAPIVVYLGSQTQRRAPWRSLLPCLGGNGGLVPREERKLAAFLHPVKYQGNIFPAHGNFLATGRQIHEVSHGASAVQSSSLQRCKREVRSASTTTNHLWLYWFLCK